MTNGSCLTLTREKLTALKIIIVLHFPNILDALFAPTLVCKASLHALFSCRDIYMKFRIVRTPDFLE